MAPPKVASRGKRPLQFGCLRLPATNVNKLVFLYISKR
jgi:hypothetical protein